MEFFRYNKISNFGKKLDRLPKKSDYCPGTMMPDEYEKFNKWYKDNKNTPFLLEEQLDVSFYF